MDIILCDLLVNIAASLIYDIFKRFGSAKQIRHGIPKQVDKYIREHLNLTFNFIDDSESVLFFLRSPQVTDIISGYVFYKVTGELAGDFRSKINTKFISQSDIVGYLSKGYVTSKKDSITLAPIVLIDQLLTSLIGIVKGYYVSRMSDQEIATIFFVNDRHDRSIKEISLYLERLADHIVRSLKFELTQPCVDKSRTKEKYEKIMTEKLCRAHVYMLDLFEFNKFYVPPRLSRKDNDIVMEGSEVFFTITNQKDEKWKHIFDNDRIVYVVGGAGFGKSLFLRNIALNMNQMCLLGQEERLIIYGDLKNFLDPYGNIKPVMQFLRESMAWVTGMNYSDFSDEFIQYFLDSGLCVILLDALDEVKEDKRNDVHSTVRSFLSYHNPNNKICITSRDRGFIRMSEDCLVYFIEPLTPRQIEKYIDNIIALGKFDPSDKQDFMKRTRPLIEKGFLSSCLILSLLVRIYKSERALPDNKLDLYHKCFDYISYTREVEEKKSLNYNWDRVFPLMNEDTFTRLAQLCAPYNGEVNSSIVKDALIKANSKTYESQASVINAVNEFLKFCANRTELFVLGANEDTYKFFHRSFLDYFYALYIFKYINSVADIYTELSVFGFDSEVFELLLSLLKNRKRVTYDSLIEYVLELSKNDLEKDTPTFLPINMMIAFMREITEIYYENEFLNLILTYSKIIIPRRKGKTYEFSKVIDPDKIILSILKRKKVIDPSITDQFLDKYKAGALREFIMIADKLKQKPSVNFTASAYIFRWISSVADICSFYSIAFIGLFGIISFFDLLDNQVYLKSAKLSQQSNEIVSWISEQYKLLDAIDKTALETIIHI